METAVRDNYPSVCKASLALLSFASGCTDVPTFLKLGNLFTSAMTGNAALLAVEIGRGHFFSALHALAALLSFALGVALATKLSIAWRIPHEELRCFSRLLFVEAIFLTVCAALWSVNPDSVQGARLYGVILLSALSMGIQAVAAGSISSGINTIVFTSVLVRIVASVTDRLSRGENWPALLSDIKHHLGSFVAYVCGALLAATLIYYFLGVLIWVPIGAVLVALIFSEAARRSSA